MVIVSVSRMDWACTAKTSSEERPRRLGKAHERPCSNTGFGFGKEISLARAFDSYSDAEGKPMGR